MVSTHWIPKDFDLAQVDSVCLGTGRFLRAVLVPALVAGGHKPVLVQPRGRTFLDFMANQRDNTYPVDTVLHDGSTQTDHISCFGAFSLGNEADKKGFYEHLEQYARNIKLLGIGLTEAGLASPETPAMKDLYEFLAFVRKCNGNNICVVNTDNVPNNGSVLQAHMLHLAQNDVEMKEYLQSSVVFLNSMVDRITSQREGSNGMIPRAEPVPAKALVLLDPKGALPKSFSSLHKFGVVVRSTPEQLQVDIALKLRVANGTHTAIAHLMALMSLTNTDALAKSNDTAKLLWNYIDALFESQIWEAGNSNLSPKSDECKAVYEDWKKRLKHPYFGLSTYFITQNGSSKGGIRLGPTVRDLIRSNKPVSVLIAYAFAVILRWLTPTVASMGNVYKGSLVAVSRKRKRVDEASTTEYADGLRYNLNEGWYEFKCDCNVGAPIKNLSDWLFELGGPMQPPAYTDIVRAYLLSPEGGNLADIAYHPSFEIMVQGVATLYARMKAGDDLLGLLQEMVEEAGCYTSGMRSSCMVLVDGPGTSDPSAPLHYRQSPIPDHSALLKIKVDSGTASGVVVSEVASSIAIDLHTHLLPPTHGPLCLWGIDELLAYHYLVAEFFMTAPVHISPETFYAKTKKEQADIIWKALFVDRTPISEACRGVITTLVALGLQKEVDDRDLNAIRSFYSTYRNRGLQGAEEFSEMVFKKAGVKYNIMTNIPFDNNEAQYWRPKRKEYSPKYKSALRVDPLLSGDRQTIEAALKGSGYDVTLEAARQYLRDWCDTMMPEYMMASTPHDFVFQEGSLATTTNTGINEESMKEPGAFVTAARSYNICNGTEDDVPSIIDENCDFLSQVLMKVCEERDLPVALKIGAHRGLNPRLKQAGDGVVAFADAAMLGRLCQRFPKVRFLATFLSRNNQHEACVLASKFRNLHIYGCWWFCNNPSIIEEITKMRVEMLGTAFTAQHSDARVLDQLLYKWPHSRAVIADVLQKEIKKLALSGWVVTRAELRRDVGRLFGGSYEEYMAKSLA